MDKAAKLIEDAVAPVAKAVRGKKAEAGSETKLPPSKLPRAGKRVAVAGDFNTLLGAPENWAPQYDEAQMQLDELDQLWKLSAEIPAGHYTFKIALNRSWDENYGAFGAFDGANHELHHSGGQLTIRYNHQTRDIPSTDTSPSTDSVQSEAPLQHVAAGLRRSPAVRRG